MRLSLGEFRSGQVSQVEARRGARKNSSRLSSLRPSWDRSSREGLQYIDALNFQLQEPKRERRGNNGSRVGLNSVLREDNGEARCSIAVDGIAYWEAEKKIASWELPRAGRSERNGRGPERLSLGDTGSRWPPGCPPPQTPEPCTHQPLVVMVAVEPLEGHPRSGGHPCTVPGTVKQAVSTPMKSSTHGLLQTEDCMNCTTQDKLQSSCSSKLPALHLTQLL